MTSALADAVKNAAAVKAAAVMIFLLDFIVSYLIRLFSLSPSASADA